MKNGKKGISFIEVIVSVAILVIISVVAVTTHTSMVDKTNNSKIVSDMTSLENSLSSYKNDTSKIPTPNGNLKYFKEDTSYAHDITDAFGVSGFVTEKTIPKKYINYLPLDPKTGQYYALSTTKDESSFEIAGIVKNNESYKSKVSGNWSGESGPYNLVREYNGPNFVYDDATENFPYNPEELLLTAKISDYSGSVLINSKNYTKDEILSLDLREGDKIEVGTGSSAEMYLSDGSYSTLGDVSSKTEVVLANMRYVEKNNLFTNVKIALNMGSIWTKASSLGEKSDYEIYTTDTVASVRGTIFGVSTNGNKSEISVIEGKVEVKEINSIPEIVSGDDFDNLTRAIENDKIDEIVSENVGEIPGVTNGSGVIVVEKGEEPKALEINKDVISGTTGGVSEISGTGIIEELPEDIKEKIEGNVGEINNSIRLELLELSNTGDTDNRYLKLGLTDTLRKGNIVKINDVEYKNSYLPTSNTGLTLTGNVLSGSGIVNISICKNKKCTRELKVDFTKKISFKKDVSDDTKTDEDLDSSCDKSFILNGNCVENSLESEGYKVVAYAPYDVALDYNLHTGSTNSISAYSNSINNCNPNAITGDVFEDGHCTISSTPTGANGFYFDSFNRIVKSNVLRNINGVFLDNDNTSDNDFLKYNISSLNLNSGSGFAIEMSVRGAALKRKGGTYFLFQMGNIYLNLDTYPGKGTRLKTGYKNPDFNDTEKIKLDDLNTLQDDNFYKIIVKYNHGLAKLYIYGDDINIQSNTLLSGAIPSINLSDLYIGTEYISGIYKSQWNDIIDYVKIYKQ